MSENTKVKLETIDKIIIFIICFIFLLAILCTIWWVKYKADKELKDTIANYSDIQYSSYKYNIKDGKIYFYKDIKESSVYKCINNCSIEGLQPEQFIFDNDNLVLIKDNLQYIVYDIITSKTIMKLDEYPKSLSVKEYGIISNNGKYGLINKQCKVIDNFEFDEIASLDNYIFLIKENNLTVYDNKLKKLSQKQLGIKDLEDFVLLNNKNKITVVITTKNSSTSYIYRFDKKLNNFIN